MADKKISQLTGATTPLAGTEVLPIVQGGSTVKVSVANVTAGRAVDALSLSTTTGVKNTSAGSDTASTPDGLFLTDAANKNAIVQLGASGQLSTFVFEAGGAGWRRVAALLPNGNSVVDVGNLVVGTAGKGIDFSANANLPGMTSELLNWYEEGTWTPADASGASLTFTFNATSYYTKIGNVVTCNLDVTFPTTSDTSVARITLPFTPKVSGAGGNIGYTTKAGGIYVALSSAGSFTFVDLISNFLTNANMSTTRSQISFSYIAA